MAALTTKEYIVTTDDIEVVEKPSKDIAKDELDQEDKLVEAIVKRWNRIVEIAENNTIKIAIIIDKLLRDFPDEKRKSIMIKVTKHKDLKTSISKDRIYQGLRLVKRRPDLINYTPESHQKTEPYLKEDGSMFWEFYFEIEKYSLGNDVKVRLERDGIDNKWFVRELRRHIYEERDIISGDGKNERKRELIKVANAILHILDVKEIERAIEFLEKMKNDKRLDKRTDKEA